MLFNSDVFLKFFLAFLFLYGLVRNNLKARNVLIVVASYLFYGWWAPAGEATAFTPDFLGYLLSALWHCRFLGLLVLTSLVDFSVGLGLERLQSQAHRKLLLSASIAVNLGILGFFKYWNFFADSFASALSAVGLTIEPRTLSVVLPVGISFYTFQSMSYAIDVYRRDIAATRSLIHFLAFVSFFPQLVAGPIERASHLLPQFGRTVVITRAMLEEGIWLILWGMFKKVALADNFAPLVEMVFGEGIGPVRYSAPTVLLGTLAFGLQIYCDFSGYSDIARGTARVLGFDIMWNFNLPYVATNLREFWRRWHISLSSWLRDYLYISLGGNRRGRFRTYVNLLITMLLGGLWHGAAWNFILWGLWHGVGLALLRSPTGHWQLPVARPVVRRLFAWLVTMFFVFYGWLLFRAHSFHQIVAMTRALGEFSAPMWIGSFAINLVAFALPLVLMELWQWKTGDRLIALTLPVWGKAMLQGGLLIGILLFWERAKEPFIYFQF
jgi:D-alanyl-lipoteichoic acid acyltransferase DltB (MBOAT superfamily)